MEFPLRSSFQDFSPCPARSAGHGKPPARRVDVSPLYKTTLRPVACDCSGRREFESEGRWWRMAQKAYILSHTKWVCEHHVVFT